MNARVKYGIDNPKKFLQLNNNLEYVAIHLIRKFIFIFKKITYS